MFRFALPSLLLLAISGCAKPSHPLVPVSGVVTLDGQPLIDARVSFQPRRVGKDINSGPGSYGKTDAQGRFHLKTINNGDGAVVGMHDVRISTLQHDPDRANEGKVLAPEKVPTRYQQSGALTFTVPEGGTSSADFTLTTK